MSKAQVKQGVIAGDDLQALFAYAKANKFALPAVNVVNTSTVNVIMETAAEIKSPAMIQFSNGGAQFYAGKGLNNDGQRACIAGASGGCQAEIGSASAMAAAGRPQSVYACDWPRR